MCENIRYLDLMWTYPDGGGMSRTNSSAEIFAALIGEKNPDIGDENFHEKAAEWAVKKDKVVKLLIEAWMKLRIPGEILVEGEADDEFMNVVRESEERRVKLLRAELLGD
ncbi:Hypothetical protein D9617_27g045440 [Elsinoe fawcettii]|nr:Hypothetical protein D9617_27g045440 [Elsinoe fawcettii]